MPHINPTIENIVAKPMSALFGVFRRQIYGSLHSQRNTAVRIFSHYATLSEYLPRYVEIMSRSNFGDYVVGFLAGFFGGQLGVAGAGIWDNWRESNDNDFVDKFVNALQSFLDDCRDYCSSVEDGLSLVFDRYLDEMSQIHRNVFNYFETLAESGTDVEALYYENRQFKDPIDDDEQAFFEIVLQNIQDNRNIHYKTVENIRQMLGL
jgi:hypothetical protein